MDKDATYTVELSDDADKALSKMDPFQRKLIVSWIDDKLKDCTDPRRHGKGLSGNLSGRWRYRIGDYRVLAKIFDDKVLILVLDIGHRREIYRR